MDILKRATAYLFIFLLIVSLYKDFTTGLFSQSSNPSTHTNQSTQEKNDQTVTLTVEYGDTVLSIIEQLNDGNINQFDITQIRTDFEQLNPNTNPYELSPGMEYQFPLYSD